MAADAHIVVRDSRGDVRFEADLSLSSRESSGGGTSLRYMHLCCPGITAPAQYYSSRNSCAAVLQ